MLALVAGGSSAAAQVPEFSDSLGGRSIIARTERFLSTHTTSLSTDFVHHDQLFHTSLRSYLQSSTTLIGIPTTRDQADVLLDLEYELPGAMRLFSIAQGTLTNEVRNETTVVPGLNNTAASFLGVGTRWVGADSNRVGVAAGVAYNRQLNQEDVGGGLYGELNQRFDLPDYSIDVNGRGYWYNISPRHNSNAWIDARLARHFEDGAFATVGVRYETIGTDNYLKRTDVNPVPVTDVAYDGVQRRLEDRVYLTTDMSFLVGDDASVQLQGSLSDGSIGQYEVTEGLPPLPTAPEPYRYDRGDLRIDASVAGSWTPADGRLDMRLEYSTSEQRNTVEPLEGYHEAELKRKRTTSAQNDFISQHLVLSGSAEYWPSRHDTLSMNGSVAIFRYDTPSELNAFDRDEQSIQAQITWARAFSPWLGAQLTAQAYLTHLVYLFAANSGDNNWNRVFRLAPSVRYDLGKDFSNLMEGEVYANYTEYDFDLTGTVRGRSFREMRIRDSMAFDLTHTLTVIADGDLRISERGSFSWDQFAESLLERTRTEGIEAELLSRSIGSVTFGVGGRLSRVKTDHVDPDGALAPFSDRTSVGPTARLIVRLSRVTELDCSGWWEHKFENSQLVGRTPSLFITLGLRV